MFIKLIEDRRINGEHCAVGDEVEVSDSDGRYLISSKAAEPIGKPSKQAKTTEKRVKLVMAESMLVEGKHADIGDDVNVLEHNAKFLLGRRYAVPAGSDEAKELQGKANAAPGVSLDDFAAAVSSLEDDNDDHWTTDGRPEVKALKDAGISVTAVQRNELWKQYTEANDSGANDSNESGSDEE